MAKDVNLFTPNNLKPGTVTLAGGMDVGLEGLNDIRIKELAPITINPLKVDLGLDCIQIKEIAPITINPLKVDLGLDDINIDLGLDNIRINKIDDFEVKLDLGLDNMKLDLGLDNINACFAFAIKELPSMKVHMPSRFEFGFNLFGMNIWNFCFNGKTALITEENVPKMFYAPQHDAPPNDYKGPNEDEIKIIVEEELAENNIVL